MPPIMYDGRLPALADSPGAFSREGFDRLMARKKSQRGYTYDIAGRVALCVR